MSFDWGAKSTEEKLQFALDWESHPVRQWNEVKEVQSTSEALQILHEIAGLRTTIHVYEQFLGPGFSLSEIITSELDSTTLAVKLADTDGVVQRDPRHAGGWWGLLTLTSEPIGASGGANSLRMPPGTSTFMSAFEHLTTHARGSGPAGIRAAPETLITFGNAQRTAAGSDALAHMAITLNNLMRQNAGDLMHKYLLSLRGHGTEEPGGRHQHHLADIVAARSDVDARLAQLLTVSTFRASIFRFAQIFPATGTNTRNWPGMVSRHLHLWSVSMGNHAGGEAWLLREVRAARDRWARTTEMVEELTSSRETERAESEAVTERTTELRRNVLSVRDQVRTARSHSTSEERITALTTARETVRGWRTTFGGSGTGSVTGSGSESTEASVSGGADVIVADATVDASETITLGLEALLSATIRAEQQFSGSTSDSTSTTETTRLSEQWNDLLEMARTVERQLTREVSRSREYTEAVRRVIAISDVAQQVRRLHAGILEYLGE